MNKDHIATPEEEEAFNMVEQQSNLGKQILRDMKKQKFVDWIDAIVVNLVRSGINKHRARELADHFISLISPAAYEQGIQEGMKRERALWQMQAEGQKIEQPRPLTDMEIYSICKDLGMAQLSTLDFARAIEAAHGIKEKNQ